MFASRISRAPTNGCVGLKPTYDNPRARPGMVLFLNVRRARNLVPANLVQVIVVDPEVVRDLVD
jgi:hypothetical protein